MQSLCSAVGDTLQRLYLESPSGGYSGQTSPQDISALRPEHPVSAGNANTARAAHFPDGEDYLTGGPLPTSPSGSDVLDDAEELLEEREDVAEKKGHYTSRGTTVLTRSSDNREIKCKSRIVVAVRKRPLNRMERGSGYEDVMETNHVNEIVLHEPKVKVDLRRYTFNHRFYFDVVLDERSTNADVYRRTARALIDTVFDGGCATCFAYGQTGSGKTHTMLGKGKEPGMYALAAEDMFQRVDEGQELVVSFYEIYSGKLYDLLNYRKPLRCLEDEKRCVNIRGLTEHLSKSAADVMHIIEQGNRLRSSGFTGANDTSSRSHAILEIKVRPCGAAKPIGKFTFIDLAGSERGADTVDCARQTRLEGAEINRSLLALKECIRSLDQNKRHVPFRGSKLTEVLRDCFVGNCRTVMIGAVSPSNGNCEHTLNTLRYADRVKELRKAPSERRPLEETEKVESVMLESEPALRPPAPLSGRLSMVLTNAPVGRRSGTLPGCHSGLHPPPIDGRTSPPPRRLSVPTTREKPRATICNKRLREEDPPLADRPRGGGCARCETAAELMLAERNRTLERYSVYLEADMNCIKNEYQIKYNAEQKNADLKEFIARARAAAATKQNAIRIFLAQLDDLERTSRQMADMADHL